MLPWFSLLLLPFCHGELEMVLAVWRHGDRAPEDLPYPLDIYDEKYWPRGWNQLTNIGIEQTFELGTFLRERYAGTLFREQFNRKEVFVQSSDSERALDSVQSVMAGLFPPQGQFIWNSSFIWQPIPIHSNGYNEDDLLLKPTSVQCSAYDQLKKQRYTDAAKEMNVIYEGLFKKLTVYSGMPIEYANVKALNDINKELIHNLAQPDWINEVWNGQTILQHLGELKRLTRTSEFNTPQMAKFRGGYLLNDWLTKIKNVKDGKKSYKAILYSSHDGTVSALTYAMGVNNDQLVPYAACFMVEVHKEMDNYFTKIFYRNGTRAEDVHQLHIPNCAMECPVDDFVRLLKPQAIETVEEFNELCKSCSSGAVSVLLLLFAMFWNNNV